MVGVLALTRLLRSLLFEVEPTDPGTLVAVSLAVGAVALLASYIPARRATRVDPFKALRFE
jgi:ABC-type lipoprotein release transport system permease subunit